MDIVLAYFCYLVLNRRAFGLVMHIALPDLFVCVLFAFLFSTLGGAQVGFKL